MASLINLKVVLALFLGLAIGLVFHLHNSPGRYATLYQNSYEFLHPETRLIFNDTEEERINVVEQTTIEEAPPEPKNIDEVLEITNCQDVRLAPSMRQRGKYWVLYNYVQAETSFRCHESITYTTQGDYTFLDNLIPLVERWEGPISLALYAPGEDFHVTIDSIIYLRNCATSLIRKYVTFHVFFDASHIPKQVEKMRIYYKAHEYDLDCEIGPPFENVSRELMYKFKNNLTYPINVGRNVARETVQTHFVFTSDIELYPTRKVIPKFLQMVIRKRDLFIDTTPKVFVLPIFEILAEEQIPENKTQLETMYNHSKAFLFHGKLCPRCHSVPNETEWLKETEGDQLNVFSQTKRVGEFKQWESFYIGTNAEPLFDERLSWEGQKNKMTQQFAMCLMDYTYMVLDNAFIIHKPGVKKIKVQMQKYTNIIRRTDNLIRTDIRPQLEIMYGKKRGCYV